MTLWQQLQITLKGPRETGAEDLDLLRDVEALVQRERRAPDEVILSLLSQALEFHRAADRTHRCWESLSPREKQVAALVCRGLTGRQVAAKLFISPETVKTHVRHILRKFNLRSRRDLRKQLAGWELSEWVQVQDVG